MFSREAFSRQVQTSVRNAVELMLREGPKHVVSKTFQTAGQEVEWAVVDLDGRPHSTLGVKGILHELGSIGASTSRSGSHVSGELFGSTIEFVGHEPMIVGNSVDQLYYTQRNFVLQFEERYPGLRLLGAGLFPGLTIEDFRLGIGSEAITRNPRYRVFDCAYEQHFREPHLPLHNLEEGCWAAFAPMHACQFHVSTSYRDLALMLNISRYIAPIILSVCVNASCYLGRRSTEYMDLRPLIWDAVFQHRTGLGDDWYRSSDDYFRTLLATPSFLDPSVGDESYSARLLDSIDRHMPDVAEWTLLQYLKYENGTRWPSDRAGIFPTSYHSLKGTSLTVETRHFGAGNYFQNQMVYAYWLGLMKYYYDLCEGDNATFIKYVGSFDRVKKNMDAVCRKGLQAELDLPYGSTEGRNARYWALSKFLQRAAEGLRSLKENESPLYLLRELVQAGWTPSGHSDGIDSDKHANLLAGLMHKHPLDWNGQALTFRGTSAEMMLRRGHL